MRAILQEPHMQVYFAGEHLADEQGFMEGAVVTGNDTAENVQKAAASKLLQSERAPGDCVVLVWSTKYTHRCTSRK